MIWTESFFFGSNLILLYSTGLNVLVIRISDRCIHASYMGISAVMWRCPRCNLDAGGSLGELKNHWKRVHGADAQIRDTASDTGAWLCTFFSIYPIDLPPPSKISHDLRTTFDPFIHGEGSAFRAISFIRTPTSVHDNSSQMWLKFCFFRISASYIALGQMAG